MTDPKSAAASGVAATFPEANANAAAPRQPEGPQDLTEEEIATAEKLCPSWSTEGRALAEVKRRRDQPADAATLVGGFACRICGRDTPHGAQHHAFPAGWTGRNTGFTLQRLLLLVSDQARSVMQSPLADDLHQAAQEFGPSLSFDAATIGPEGEALRRALALIAREHGDGPGRGDMWAREIAAAALAAKPVPDALRDEALDALEALLGWQTLAPADEVAKARTVLRRSGR